VHLDERFLQFSGLGLAHWSHFTVCRFTCVYFLFLIHTVYVLYYCEHGGVDLMGLKDSPYDAIFLQCFDTVGWVI